METLTIAQIATLYGVTNGVLRTVISKLQGHPKPQRKNTCPHRYLESEILAYMASVDVKSEIRAVFISERRKYRARLKQDREQVRKTNQAMLSFNVAKGW